jgi:hypothetical protein
MSKNITNHVICSNFTEWTTSVGGTITEVSIPKHANKCDFHIIDISAPIENIEFFEGQLIDRGFNKFLITHTSFHTESKHSLFFSADLIIRSLEYDQTALGDRDFYISCLSRRPSHFRVLNYFKMINSNYFNERKCVATLHRGGTDDNPHCEYLETDGWDDDVKLFWDSLEPSTIENDVTTLHPAFYNTYANICIETDDKVPAFSEKIAKPLASGQFFFVISGGTPMKDLKSMGFDIFDDVFDHTVYDDSNMDEVSRINALHDLISKHFDSLPKLFKDHKDRIRKNQELFLSEEFRQGQFEKLRNKIIEIGS